MLDVIVRGGTVVDGTGTPGRHADVGVRAGRVVAVGDIDERATREIDAEGKVVAPGFVDVHTHYDAQVFWDTTLSPSPLHGVTTVIGGNCGFTIAPLAPEHGDYLMRMLARVEGMPLTSLQQGVPWDWTSFGDYLNRIDGTLAPNAGFLVGHCAIRRLVMGEDATKGAANEDQLLQMERLLGASLAAGGLGFSSSWARTHNDAAGEMVPSRHATDDELIALCRVVGRHPGTTLEFIPGVPPFEDYAPTLMARMSAAANRPLNWNVLFVNAGRDDVIERMLSASDVATEHGGRVLALTMPDSPAPRLCFDNGFLLDTIPGWERPMALPHDEKKAMLASSEGREALRNSAADGKQAFGLGNWGRYIINECITEANRRFEGRSVADVANELDKDAFDALLDIVVADDLMTGFGFPPSGDRDEDWEARLAVWRDKRAIIGASDAGAHLDFLATFNYSTALLGKAVRDRELLPIEEAIQMLTDTPARLYGIRDRGRLAPGWFADIVVLDPNEITPGEVRMRFDLPGGAPRLFSEPTGIDRVLVNGTEIVDHGEFTDARPGTLLRSGRDTETVTAHS
ncbi:MAG: N-acyl-D-aspartate/D-glutamate deacylase [Actinomycetia bacterium]|jgi:N-acyl-D-aspartate/D-glutamate deacylase|nr:N-acyl-D-aspartate/D-glutamate deacylase [Actinomycetes bacterium]